MTYSQEFYAMGTQMEITIFNAINYNVLLVSTYEFIKTYIYDFIQNNRSEDDENLIQISYIKKLEVIAIYLAKIMLHEESYYQYKYYNIILIYY